MLRFRQSDKAVHMLVGVSAALVLGCADSVDPSVHGASSLVTGAASQIQVAPSSASLVAGERSQLRCAAFDGHGVMLSTAPTWTSSDPTVMTVLSDGSVTAVHSGSASASCQIGSQIATSLITVSAQQVAFVEVSPGAGTIPTGATLQLSGIPRDSLGFPVPGQTVQWSSADTTIATVTSAGVVTARGTGDANIVATSVGVAGMTKVKVTGVAPPPVASVQVAVDQTSLSVGHFTHATATAFDAQGNVLSGRAITWSVSNPSVLSVVTLNATRATISSLGQGNASITATCEGRSASVNVTVGQATVAVVVASLASSSITVGQTTLASAIPEDGFGNPIAGQTVTWTSLDPTIATVSSSGIVTGVAPGSVVIRAAAGGITGDASLTVTVAPVASVTTTLASSTLTVGQTTQATAVPHDANGNVLTGRSVAWSSLNPAVATVSIYGLVTAVAPGSTIIRATVESKTGDANVVVSAPSSVATTASVVVTFDSSSLGTGHSSQAHATAKDAQGNVLTGKTPTWTSKTASVASVSGTGVVTGATSGTAVIQATIDGVGGSGSLPVTSGAVTSPTTASVVVTFDSTSITVGHTSQAKAVAKDASGNPIAGKTATWISNSAGLASVGSSTGIVTGLTSGSAVIQATIDGVNGTASLLVKPTTVITAPTPSGAVASANFDDGTLGPFTTEGAPGVDVIADPTARATGKVARFLYINGPPSDIDANLALFAPTVPSLGPSQALWFQGDFYIDSQQDVMRKLLYWMNAAGQSNGFPAQTVITLQPSGVAGQSTLMVALIGPQDNSTYVSNVTLQAWHTIKVHMQLNSAPGAADGILEVWMDGTLQFSKSNVAWGSSTYPAFSFDTFGFGYQAQANTPINEYRYWDNIIYSRSPLP